MLFRLRNSGGLVFLVILALLAFWLGKTFDRALTLLMIMSWTCAFCFFVYLILFKGMKFTLFKQEGPEHAPVEAFDNADDPDAVHREMPEGSQRPDLRIIE